LQYVNKGKKLNQFERDRIQGTSERERDGPSENQKYRAKRVSLNQEGKIIKSRSHKSEE